MAPRYVEKENRALPPLPGSTAHTLGSLEAVETSLEQTLVCGGTHWCEAPVCPVPAQTSLLLAHQGGEGVRGEICLQSISSCTSPPLPGKLNMIYFFTYWRTFSVF